MKKFDKRKVVTGALVVAVALSSFAVSGTYARYTSEATASDNARVAKWGWSSSNTLTLDLFDTSYKSTDNAAQTDVVSSDTNNVVAPGTSGVTGFGLPTFKPETNYTIALADAGTSADGTNGKIKYYIATVAKAAYDAAAATNDISIKDGVFKVGANNLTPTGTYTSVSTLIDGLNGSLGAKVFAANTAANDNLVYLIGWEWVIGGAGDNTSDTNLGNSMVDGATEMPKVIVDLKATFEQSELAATP